MTKRDWLVTFIRILGLYLIGTHLASLITTGTSLAIVISQKTDLRTAGAYVWQAPVVSAVVVITGLFFLFKAPSLANSIEKSDR